MLEIGRAPTGSGGTGGKTKEDRLDEAVEMLEKLLQSVLSCAVSLSLLSPSASCPFQAISNRSLDSLYRPRKRVRAFLVVIFSSVSEDITQRPPTKHKFKINDFPVSYLAET